MFLGFSGFVIFLVIASVAIAAIMFSIHNTKKIKETWAQVARKYHLVVDAGAGHSLSGNVSGIYLHIKTVTRGSGKNRSTYTVYTAYSSAVIPQGMSLTREGFFSKVGKMFGGQDIQTGDRKLDESLIIKGKDSNGIIALLRIPQVRDAILYFIARHPGMVVNQQNFYFEEHGIASKPDRMSAAIDDLVYLTKTVEAALSRQPQTGSPALNAAKPASPVPIAVAKFDDLTDPLGVGGSSAARAEILSETPTHDSLDPNGASAKQALSEAFSMLKSTVENPTAQKKAEPAKPFEDAFAAPLNDDAFTNPTLNDDVFAPTPSSLDSPSQAPQKAVADSSTESLTSSADDVCEGSDDIYDLIKELTNVGFGGNRQEIIDRHNCVTFNLMVYVDRVDSTFGFDTPDHLKDGKTLEGHLSSGEKVAVRFPESMNDRIAKLHSGGEFGVSGKVIAWDDLFKKVAIDYVAQY